MGMTITLAIVTSMQMRRAGMAQRSKESSGLHVPFHRDASPGTGVGGFVT